MIASDGPRPGYRPCVGVMLINEMGLVFTAQRLDMAEDAWQMPQGGIDAGETPRQAALRELKEETGTDKARIIAESAQWLSYDLPAKLRRALWSGQYRGQTQKWFLARFTGEDADIDLNAHVPEFSSWQWTPLDDLSRLIVPFKREVYEKVVDEFRMAVRR